MILPISCFGSPILRAKTKNVSFDQSTKDLIHNMWETMYNANGVGLAAPQVNKDLRLFIIDTSSFQGDNDFPNHIPLKEVFINPIIKKEEGERWEFNEGCLSIPDIREHVKRKSVIRKLGNTKRIIQKVFTSFLCFESSALGIPNFRF